MGSADEQSILAIAMFILAQVSNCAAILAPVLVSYVEFQFIQLTVPSQLLPSSEDSSNLISPLLLLDNARTLNITLVMVPRSADSSNVKSALTDLVVQEI